MRLGENLIPLSVTSIRPGGVDLSDQPLAGGVFALRPGVQGLPEPKFPETHPLAYPTLCRVPVLSNKEVP